MMNTEKYENAILYLCQKLGGTVQGRMKFYKLLYFADFDMYEYKDSVRSITGTKYKALQKGPIPEEFDRVVASLVKKSKLKVEKKKQYPSSTMDTTFYTRTGYPNLSVFNQDEMYILDRVIRHYGHLNGQQLSSITHDEAPWRLTTDDGKKFGDEEKSDIEIPLYLSQYRDTQFEESCEEQETTLNAMG